MVKRTTVVLGGEITTQANINYEKIVKRVANKLGYQVDEIINLISEQSPEINNAVSQDNEIGAGDQGIMFGYATRETDSFLPKGFDLANKIIERIEEDVEKPYSWLKGDAKTQVTIDLDTNEIDNVVVSVCHQKGHSHIAIVEYMWDLLGDLVHPRLLLVNPAGEWTIGGAIADCGLTGRKIVCDQYGGYCAVGGGAFSGKDPSKVDRSASYMARQIAVDLIKRGNIEWCEVQLGYAIGLTHPVSVTVKTNLPEQDEMLSQYVARHYNLTPKGIINHLDLLNKDYEKLAEGCHYRKGSW